MARLWNMGFSFPLQMLYDTLSQVSRVQDNHAATPRLVPERPEYLALLHVLLDLIRNIPYDMYALAGNLRE